MRITTYFVITYLISVCHITLSNDCSPPTTVRFRESPLNKDHLTVIVSEFPISLKIQRNATGHLIDLDGVSPLILEWLSLRYKFNYSIFDVNAPSRPFSKLEDEGPHKPGLISYAVGGECDVVLAAITPTPIRLHRLELVHPWMYSTIAFIIPMPEISQNNVDAVVKPFQFSVWMLLIAASVSFIGTLLYFNRFFGLNENVYMYVIGTLLSQGTSIDFTFLYCGYISSKITPIRLAVGAWCLLTLVLLNVYNGILISYITATRHEPPLINTFKDLSNDNIFLLVDKGFAGDVVFSSAKDGLYKQAGDKLRFYSKSRCDSTQHCIDLVKSLPARHVYLNAMVALKAAIENDYKQTRQCKLTITAEVPSSRQIAGWGLAKHSPFLEKFNRGTLRLHEMGFISKWEKEFEPDAKPCFREKDFRKIKDSGKPLKRLSLANLGGAFAVLGVGFMLSILVFLIEIIVSRFQRGSGSN